MGVKKGVVYYHLERAGKPALKRTASTYKQEICEMYQNRIRPKEIAGKLHLKTPNVIAILNRAKLRTPAVYSKDGTLLREGQPNG